MKRIVSSRSNQQKRKYLEVKETLLPAVADPSKPDYKADMKARVILPLDAFSALTLIIGLLYSQVEAGLHAKDVMVGLGDQNTKNIYNYTHALDAVTIGEPTQITVIRDIETLSLPITSIARPQA